ACTRPKLILPGLNTMLPRATQWTVSVQLELNTFSVGCDGTDVSVTKMLTVFSPGGLMRSVSRLISSSDVPRGAMAWAGFFGVTQPHDTRASVIWNGTL